MSEREKSPFLFSLHFLLIHSFFGINPPSHFPRMSIPLSLLTPSIAFCMLHMSMYNNLSILPMFYTQVGRSHLLPCYFSFSTVRLFLAVNLNEQRKKEMLDEYQVKSSRTGHSLACLFFFLLHFDSHQKK